MICAPLSLGKSNTCVGWPSSNITKLLASTRLLRGTCPIEMSRSASHFGDGPTCRPRTTRPVYRGHSCGSLLVMVTNCEAGPAVGRGFGAGHLSLRPEIAAISRAIPMWHPTSPRLDVISKSCRTSPPSTSSRPSNGKPARVSSSACSSALAGGSKYSFIHLTLAYIAPLKVPWRGPTDKAANGGPTGAHVDHPAVAGGSAGSLAAPSHQRTLLPCLSHESADALGRS